MKRLILLILISSWLVVMNLTLIRQLFNNTLKNNGQWRVVKLNLQKSVMGAENFFSGTQALNGQHLNLGAWHGFQEVITKKNFEFDQAKFDALFTQGSYLFFYYFVGETQKSALKFDPVQKKISCLDIEKSGKFLDPIATHDFDLPVDRWLKILVTSRENKIVIKINDQELSCPTTQTFPIISQVGFKNGWKSVLVDNVYLSKNQKTVFRDNFTLRTRYWQFFWPVFVFLTGIEIMLLKLITRKKSNSSQSGFFLILINLIVLTSAILTYGYLLFFFTGNYPNLSSFFSRWRQRDETDWIKLKTDTLSREFMEQYSTDTNEKIIFIGSSQTWGAGVLDDESAFVNQFQKELTEPKLASSSAPVLGLTTNQPTVVNTGISGAVSEILFEEYQKNWLKLNPKLVIINLSNNDFEYGVEGKLFRKNLQAFVDLNNSLQIKTVFILEATAKEYQLNNPFHQIVKEVAEKNNLQIINTHQMMQEKDNTGQLWWDFIHPTDYGHQLLGKYIAEQLLASSSSSQLTPEQTLPQIP